MEDKKFGGSLFGYSKKDVGAYIEGLVSAYEKKMGELDDDIKDLKRQNQTLASENAELFNKVNGYEVERSHVSNAVISAEIRAAKVLDDAKKDADELVVHKKAELIKTQAEIDDLKEQIKSLKLAAVATVRKYEEQFDRLTGESTS